ncbi:hypothetical protein J2S70_000966 [Trueperella bonasi]|uniref:DUF11 domain-containing protein n=1 Tax=Trueperella bonasi TaxID=312286 RepID=A0ABT9NGB7_9ACTO|nr:hypothetical protein [Trueperella bonasi]MDP9806384.1 hypothetical protein [Trueperella bonasi]
MQSTFSRFLTLVLGLFLVATPTGTALATNANQARLEVSIRATETPIESGEATTFRIDWSCSAVDSSCADATVTFKLDELTETIHNQPTAQIQLAEQSTGSYVSKPDTSKAKTEGVVVWNLGDVAAGANGQMGVRIKTPNLITPDGATYTATAETSGTGVTGTNDTADMVVSAQPRPDVEIRRELAPSRVGPQGDDPESTWPAIGALVEYRVQSGYEGSYNDLRSGWGFNHDKINSGTLGMTDVLTTVALPKNAIFESATHDGVYDPATHSVSWPAWSAPQQLFSPRYRLVVKYPAEHFPKTSTVSLTATMAGKRLDTGETLSDTSTWTHGFKDRKASGKISKHVWKNRVSRGEQAGYNFRIDNTGNVPLDVVIEDYLPCPLTSPTDGSTDCTTPALKDIKLSMPRGIGTSIHVEYTTNTGRTLEHIQNSSTRVIGLPVEDTEWVTYLKITAEGIPAGTSQGMIRLQGTVVEDIPEEAPANTPYKHVNPQDGGTRVENCASVLRLTNEGTTIVDETNSCAGFHVVAPSPKIGTVKWMGPTPRHYEGISSATALSPAGIRATSWFRQAKPRRF